MRQVNLPQVRVESLIRQQLQKPPKKHTKETSVVGYPIAGLLRIGPLAAHRSSKKQGWFGLAHVGEEWSWNEGDDQG